MKLILEAAVALVLTLALAALVAEWVVGCGEHYVDSKGVTHTNQCLWQQVSKL